MIFDDKGNIRLTKSEFNMLRTENAKQGNVLNQGDIKTSEDHWIAIFGGIPLEILEDMQEFFETGSSPLTRRGMKEREAANNSDCKTSDE